MNNHDKTIDLSEKKKERKEKQKRGDVNHATNNFIVVRFYYVFFYL